MSFDNTIRRVNPIRRFDYLTLQFNFTTQFKPMIQLNSTKMIAASRVALAMQSTNSSKLWNWIVYHRIELTNEHIIKK